MPAELATDKKPYRSGSIPGVTADRDAGFDAAGLFEIPCVPESRNFAFAVEDEVVADAVAGWV